MRLIKMEKQKIWFGFVIILLVAVILVSGCTSDTEYFPPSKVESSSMGEETHSEPESAKTQTFNVGDTATDNELKVTVNDVKFVSKINEKDTKFLVVEAPSGKQYALIDITVENVLSETQIISVLTQMTILDQGGYNYIVDFEGLTALDKSFKDGGILPGMKKRGVVVYLVPSDATDLKLQYSFESFAGTIAVFDIR